MSQLPKKFRIPAEKIRPLIEPMGGCIASDRITVGGSKVGYMYREASDQETDSGWRFFSGDESQQYVDSANNLAIYDVNTICNYDPAIIPYLQSAVGSSFGRVDGSDRFEPE